MRNTGTSAFLASRALHTSMHSSKYIDIESKLLSIPEPGLCAFGAATWQLAAPFRIHVRMDTRQRNEELWTSAPDDSRDMSGGGGGMARQIPAVTRQSRFSSSERSSDLGRWA